MIQFDFDSIVTRIKERLQSSNDWVEILYHASNQRIIDMVAQEIVFQALYDEYLTREAKWSIAQNRSSLVAETQFLDYTPHRKIGATGDLRISTDSNFNATYSESLIIPKWSTWSNEKNTIVFTNPEEYTLRNVEKYIDIAVVQGIPKTASYTASGSPYESFIVDNASFENVYYEVFVNGNLFTELESVRLAETADEKVYSTQSLNDFSGVRFTFGNGVFGYKLNAGDNVVINYIETQGNDGEIGSAGIINKWQTKIYNSLSEKVDMYVTNLESISGGEDYQDIEDIRVKAPKGYQTRDRAVSKADYKFLIENQFAFAEKASIWGETEYNIDNNNPPGTYIDTQENLVQIAILTDLGGNITSSQETQIRDYLDERKSPTDILQFNDIDIIYVHFDIEAFVSDRSYTEIFVENEIIDTLEETYSIFERDFKENLYKSDYWALIDGVEGVRNHETTINYYKYFNFSDIGIYVVDIETNVTNLEPGSLKIYVQLDNQDFILVAIDDGAGQWIAESGYTVTGDIDYVSGVGNISITNGLTQDKTRYTIRYNFNNITDDLILTQRYQLYAYGSSDIEITFD